MRGHRRLVGIVGAAGLALGAPAAARAATVQVHPVPTAGAGLTSLAAAPDGSLWFTEYHTRKLGHIGLDGRISEVAVPNGTSLDDDDQRSGPSQIVADQGGQAMDYLTDIGDTVGSVALDGTLGRRFDNGSFTSAQSISPAPGRGVWEVFYLGDVTARLTALDGTAHDFGSDSKLGLSPATTRADGSLFYGDGSSAIRSFSPTGAPASYPLPAGDQVDAITSLAFDGGGMLHFTQTYGADDALLPDRGGEIGTLGADGVVRAQPLGGDFQPHALVRGPDGTVWWAETHGIGHLTADGTVQHADLGGYAPAALAFGGDGALWFTDSNANAVGRIAIDGSTFPAASPAPAAPVPPVAPVSPAPAPKPAAAPRIGVGSPAQRLRTVLSGRAVSARVSAQGPATVRVRATISAAAARRLHARVATGATTFTIATGTTRFTSANTRVVHLRLTKAGRSALRRAHGSVAVALRATATAPGAAARTAASRLTLTR